MRVLASGSVALTAEDGTFVIADVAAGTQTIEARLIGYVPDRRTVEIRDGGLTDITLRLPVQRVQLDTVRVMAGRDVPYQVRAIQRRARTGTGTLLSGDLIRERSSMWATDALRGMNGLQFMTSRTAWHLHASAALRRLSARLGRTLFQTGDGTSL